MEEILVATHSHWLDNAKTLCMAYMLFNLVLKYLLLIFHVSNIFKVQNHKVDKLIIEDSDLNFWNLAHLIIIPTLKLHDINNSLCTYVPFMYILKIKQKNEWVFIHCVNKYDFTMHLMPHLSHHFRKQTPFSPHLRKRKWKPHRNSKPAYWAKELKKNGKK